MNYYISFVMFVVLAGCISARNAPCAINDSVDRGFLDINKIVDGVINQVRKVLVNDGYDPLDLPPNEVYIALVGKLKLYDCKLYNLSTVFRSKEIESEKINKTVNIHAAVGFSKLTVNCLYKASLLSLLSKKGKAVVTVPKLSADTDLDFYLSTFKAHLIDLKLHNDGLIDVHLEGGLLDGLLSVLTEAISNLFQYTIIKYVENVMEDELRKILEGSKAFVQIAEEQIPMAKYFGMSHDNDL